MKSQKAITLTSLVIYITIVLIIVGILAVITGSLQGNIKEIYAEGTNNAEIDKFNVYFLKEVKKQGNEIDTISENEILFTTGNKYTFSNKCDEVDGLEYGDQTTKIIINTKGTVGNVSDDFKKFIKAVNGEFDTTEYSAKIKSELEKIKNNDRWRKEYMALNLFERDAIRKGRAEEKEIAVRRMIKKLSPEDIIELGYDEKLVYEIVREMQAKQ